MNTYEVTWPTVSNLNVLVSAPADVPKCGECVAGDLRAVAADHYRQSKGPGDGRACYEQIRNRINPKVKTPDYALKPLPAGVEFRIARLDENVPGGVVLTPRGIVVDTCEALLEAGIEVPDVSQQTVVKGFQANTFFFAFDKKLHEVLEANDDDPEKAAAAIVSELKPDADGRVDEDVFEKWLGTRSLLSSKDGIYVYPDEKAPTSRIVVQGGSGVQVHLGLFHYTAKNKDFTRIMMEPHNCGTLVDC